MRLVVRKAARRDVLLQVAYFLDELAFDAAARFPDAVEQAFRQIRKNPGMGSPRKLKNPRLAGLRSWPVPRFEDLRVYYLQPDQRTVRVLRVLHGKRDLTRILGRDAG